MTAAEIGVEKSLRHGAPSPGPRTRRYRWLVSVLMVCCAAGAAAQATAIHEGPLVPQVQLNQMDRPPEQMHEKEVQQHLAVLYRKKALAGDSRRMVLLAAQVNRAAINQGSAPGRSASQKAMSRQITEIQKLAQNIIKLMKGP